MTSLAEAYEGHVGEEGSLRRLYLGVASFLVGSLLVVVGIVAATTDVLSLVGLGTFGSRRVAGLLAGLGVPAAFLAGFVVLPSSSKRHRAAGLIGASIAVFGVSLFWYAYPEHWAGYGRNLTLPVVAVYFFGIITAFWSLFAAILQFKTRNDPGGTVSLNVATKVETRTVEVPSEESESGGMGGVGFMGDLVGEADAADGRRPGVQTASDGGSDGDAVTSPMDASARTGQTERVDATPDRYCGNCAHFDYVRTDDGMAPYCGLDRRRMDDMDACEEWRPNNRR